MLVVSLVWHIQSVSQETKRFEPVSVDGGRSLVVGINKTHKHVIVRQALTCRWVYRTRLAWCGLSVSSLSLSGWSVAAC